MKYVKGMKFLPFSGLASGRARAECSRFMLGNTGVMLGYILG